MTEEQIERVAAAIEGVQFFSRFNDWTSDHVPGLPIEIVRIVNETDDEVVARYPAGVGEAEALRRYVRRARAIAAIEAMQ